MNAIKGWALALGLALAPGAVRAQQATDLTSGSSANSPPHAAAAPQSTPQPLLGDAAAPLQALYKAGILVTANLYDDLQGNPVGGLRQGDANAGAVTLGVDADLQKLAGIPGARFHVLLTDEYGDTLQRDIGNFIKSQDWFLPGQKLQLAQLAWEQGLYGDKLNLLVGRISAATLFAHATYGCKFISGSQCPYALPLFTGGFSGYPYATWGGRVRINPTPKTYLQVGGFAVDPTRKNFGGFDLAKDMITGVVVPVEIGYETDFGNDKYPRHYKLGGWYNDATSVDPLLNTAGLSRVLLGGKPLPNEVGRGGLYGIFDQVIYRPDQSHRNLTVLGSFAVPFDQREIFSAQNTLGFYYTGPLAARPHDVLGLLVTQVLFTREEIDFMNQTLSRNGSHTFVQRDQFDLEVHYGYQLVPGVVIAPNAEYILHPDISQRLDATFAPKNALVLGVRLTLSLSGLAGIPEMLPKLH